MSIVYTVQPIRTKLIDWWEITNRETILKAFSIDLYECFCLLFPFHEEKDFCLLCPAEVNKGSLVGDFINTHADQRGGNPDIIVGK